MTSPPLNRVKGLAKTAETDGYLWSLAVSEGNSLYLNELEQTEKEFEIWLFSYQWKLIIWKLIKDEMNSPIMNNNGDKIL